MKLESSQAHFARVPAVEIPRSSFDRSHGHKTTFDAGFLIPVLVDEALPGDTFNVRMTGFARLATPIFPIMDNMYMETHFFAVPIRLVWDNWQKFCGEQTNPGDSIDFVVPQMTEGAAITTGSLSDYFGLPIGVANVEYTSLFHRAYNLIWNEWFRDQNLQNSVVVDRDDGPDSAADYVLLRRGKRHDYFTSCLPWPQKGDAVSLPLGATAPLLPAQPGVVTTNAAVLIRGVTENVDRNWNIENATTDYTRAVGYGGGGNESIKFGNTTGLQLASGVLADLSNATAATINQLRQAFQVQRLLERDARGGSRYTEIVRSHFGVTSPDARLQRPEFLGGGSSPVNVAPIAQTSSTDATTPQGNLAAIGTAVLSGHGFVKSFTEHCLIIGLVSVRADLTYQQGLNRMWSRQTRYDFYWPALSHIGEQSVLRKEIFCDGVDANDDLVFGYQERYAEYRYKPSQITGLFRSNAAGTLDPWHLAQDFAVAPLLNAAFIVEDPPVDRVIAVPSEPHFLFDSVFKMVCARPMPVYGVPGFVDHF